MLVTDISLVDGQWALVSQVHKALPDPKDQQDQ
jgi:hypothetical protein